MHRDLHSFPTRRSSDLQLGNRPCRGGVDARSRRSCEATILRRRGGAGQEILTSTTPSAPVMRLRGLFLVSRPPLDRKSTRLNSSHSQTSYAVFCLKKKK